MFSWLFEIGITEIIDIAFVSVLLYTAMVWLRKTRATFVLIGIFILGAIYILARQLDLQLTAFIFQGFFAIFLIIIVVIFQEELRHVFERIAVWSLGKQGHVLRSGMVDVLVSTLADLAKDKIGALVVIRGNDPLERHIHGGIELDGKLSEPLLKSIFDPHSAGHDGAVLLEQERVTRFAAHLPLSKDFQQLSRVGTRHSAALGLAELCDALCLVVSEERGEISVARDSLLSKVNNIQELAMRLQDFLNEKYPTGNRNKLSIQLLKENWIEKAVSLILAIGLWSVFVTGSKVTQVTFEIPVKVENLPAEYVLEGIRPSVVTATFTGPRRAFYLFDARKLAVTVDASLAELGRRTFRIQEQNLKYPKELNLDEITPGSVRLSVKKNSSSSKK